MNDIESFEKLIHAGYPCVSIITHEENDAIEIVRQASMGLKYGLQIWSAGYGVRDGLLPDTGAEKDTSTGAGGLAHFATVTEKTIFIALDVMEHVKSGIGLRVLRDTIKAMELNENMLVLIDGKDDYPPVIKSYAKEFEISLPDAEELDKLVKYTLRSIHRKDPIEIGITRRGMDAIVRNLRGLSRRQAKQLIRDAVAEDRRFDDDDVNLVMAGKRRMVQGDGLLQFIQTPLDLEEIGGMENLKAWLNKRTKAFSKDAVEFGLEAPKGVLMLGVQGSGKSLCAKAVATAWQQPLLRLDVGSLYNSYIGESERNLRKALRQTESMSPVILWIDEIEKAFASAASQSSDGGLSKRMFGTLLTWMQDHKEPVFVIATANDIEALPPELLRKGRFDEIFFIGLPKKTARRKIFEIHINKRKRDPAKFDLDKLAQDSKGFSGAEIEQAVISALHDAYSDKVDMTTEMILEVLKTSPPISVTMREKIAELYAWAEGRCVPAD